MKKKYKHKLSGGRMAKQVVNDFSKGSIISNILRLSIPMTLAQLINVLYSIVDRIYIGRMGENSSLALTGVGVCLPIITIVIAFANLYRYGRCTVVFDKTR